jgi:hypothetical protein
MRQWQVVKPRRRDEEGGGCLRQQIADAVLELAERGYSIELDKECNIIINGTAVSRPHCRSVNECVKQMLEEYKKRQESPPPPRRSPEEEEYDALLQRYLWLRWWRRDLILDALRHDRHALQNLLSRLNNPEIPHAIVQFLGHFSLDLRCIIDVFRSGDSVCVSFCVRDFEPRTYCYEQGKGWYAAPRPKFLRLRPLEDGRLVEIYTIENKELVKIA